MGWSGQLRDVGDLRNGTVRPAEPCAELLADVFAIERDAATAAQTVDLVAQRLASGGSEREWLLRRYGRVGAREYRQHLVAVTPNRGMSIVALAWGPGAETPIHDHAGWCVVSVCEGVEAERRYRVCADAQGAYLREIGSASLEPGRPIGMLADGSDIHRVGNYGRSVTLSLHVYGVDIARVGTSIRTRYDTLEVRE